MKRTLPALTLLLLLFSCSKENLYDFKDLTTYDDFIYRVQVYSVDESKPIDFRVEVNQTNGYDQNISYPYSFYTDHNFSSDTYIFAVKGYKKNSVDVYPIDNIKGVVVELREVGSGSISNLKIQYYSENSRPISVGYDFGTSEKLIEYIEE